MTVTSTYQVRIPTPPDFIVLVNRKHMAHISDFTNEELQELGREWTKLLIAKAREKR